MDKALLGKLKRLPAGARRELLKVLLADSDVRADLIRQFYEREDTRGLAEVSSISRPKIFCGSH
jgi:hypothetical protein